MEVIKCIAIDDEPHALRILEEYASKIPFLELISTFQSPMEAFKFLKQNQVDLIFLDIQMPELSGLQFLEILSNRPRIILTTAYSEFALEGYEYEVSDYLLKPFSVERFIKAVMKVKKDEASTEHQQASPVTEAQEKEKTMNTILIKGDAKNKYHRISINEILFIEGMRNYVAIVKEDGSKIITLQNMKSLEEDLNQFGFDRIHKSYLVNLNKITLIEGNSITIGEAVIPIGGSYRKDFFEKIKNWKNS